MSNFATALRSSPEKANGARLSRLIIDGGRLVLQNVFDGIHPPVTLQAALNTHYSTILRLLNKKVINKKQWDLLFPPSGNPPDSRNFDITLLFVLLRNICGLHPPTSGWNNQPNPTDTSREADLARIKWFRNELYGHVTTTGIDAPLFSAHWIELSDTLIRLGLDQAEIDRLKSAPLDEDLYMQLLFKWKDEEEDIKEQLSTISAKLDALHHPNEFQIKCIKYCEKDLLGVGSQGRVYKGTFSGRRVAVKRMYKGPHEGNYVKDEAEKLKKLDHPNVIRCFEVEEEKEFVYLALELCEKRLTDCVEQNDFHRKDSGLDGLRCLREITGAVAYLHERNICHRDINPDNILLSRSEQPRFVLADCNIAKNVHSAATVVGNPPGTPGYIAPELNKPGTRITVKADLFSLGCVFYYVISNGRHLFGPVKDLPKCQTDIYNANRPPTLKDGDFSQENTRWIKPLIARMLCYDPVQRLNAEDVSEGLEGTTKQVEPQPNTTTDSVVPTENTMSVQSEDYPETRVLNLREYQKELAEDALQGKNTIICAPTNSGKTIVAVHIVQEHLKKFEQTQVEAASEGLGNTRKPKVVFIVSTVNLVTQQKRLFLKYVSDRYKISDIAGGKPSGVPLKDLMERNDIIVMTAQVLLSAFQNEEKRVELSDISLMIFDECHHAQKEHCYNKIMEKYLTIKLKQGTRLPQVVAMTASLGVGDSGNASGHVLQVCANLDAEAISTVRKHEEELSEYAYQPDRRLVKVPRTRFDKFEEVINEVMQSIEEDVGEVDPSPPSDRSSQPQYRQWLENLEKQGAIEGDRRKVTYARHLRVYHVSLVINKFSRMKDARNSLERYFSQLNKQKFIEVDRKLMSRYNRARDTLKLYVRANEEPQNPNLLKLKQLMIAYAKFTERESADAPLVSKSKGLVFIPTRESAQTLLSWIEETEELKDILKPGIIVGKGTGESGMSRSKQDDVIKRFKSGEINILLATSVAEEGLDISDCSYVIRYNVMSNTISMVQSRGRVRAQEGKYAIIARTDSAVLKRETLNEHHECLMVEAVGQAQDMEPEEFKEKISQLQKTMMEGPEDSSKIIKYLPSDVTLFCRKCNSHACEAEHIRTLETSFRVVIAPHFEDKVILKQNAEKLTKVHCRECDEHWGVKVVIKKKEWINLRLKGFVLEYGDGLRNVAKKWTEVGFEIPVLTLEEEKEVNEED